MAKEDNAKAATAPEAKAQPEAKAATAPESLDNTNPNGSLDEQSNAPEPAKEATVEVKNAGARSVHTSRGKMVKDATKALPEAEAAALVKKGLVKTV